MTRASDTYGAIVLLAGLWLSISAAAQTMEQSREATRIDPAFAFMASVIKTQGVDAPILGRGAGLTLRVDPDGAGALLRFARPLDESEIAAIEEAGVRFLGAKDGRRPSESMIYRAWIPWGALGILEEDALLVRAEATWKPLAAAPLEETSSEVGAREVRRLPGYGLDGKGVVIGNIDSGIDVLHPAFFRADGGFYDWIDVNGNERFDPGVDAVDLNRNGQADRNEMLRLLNATVVRSAEPLELENNDTIFDPRRDWLYADMNDDERRNAGRAAGFFEDDPAYGEPIFVIDDVNGNGILDVGEKLIRLKTSKIAKYYEGDRVFERGVDLIAVVESDNFNGATHGTGVSGILVGGQAPHHDRVGLAPGADLIVYGYGLYMDWEGTIQSFYLEQAVLDGVDVLLHEWTNPIMRPLDGSTNLEALMDHLSEERGIIHVNPMGNLNRSEKHLAVPAMPEVEALLGFKVDEGFRSGNEVRPYAAIYASLQWQGEGRPRISLESPTGARTLLDEDASSMQAIPGGFIRMLYERTSRGTHLATFYLSTASEEVSWPSGSWALIVEGFEEEALLYGRITDVHTIWGGGVVWENGTRDISTLSFPATADSAFGVTAYGMERQEFGSGLRGGDLRAYAGRGPRLDGRRAVRIAAPDDPYVPLAATARMIAAGGDYGWYGAFGGTSGAAPHVAASFALLKQRFPDADGAALSRRLEESANREGLIPEVLGEFPDSQWGWGRLDMLAALDLDPELRFSSAPPRAALVVEVLEDEVLFDARGSEDHLGMGLEYRYDYDYDGIWEGGWSPSALIRVPRGGFDEGEFYYGRVEVRDARGLTSGALVSFALDDGSEADVGGRPDVGREGGFIDPEPGDSRGPSCLCASAELSRPGPLPPLLLLGAFILGGIGLLRRRVSLGNARSLTCCSKASEP